MSDDWDCYLSASVTMALWAEIERQKAATYVTTRQLICIVCCTISCQPETCEHVRHNAVARRYCLPAIIQPSAVVTIHELCPYHEQ